MQQIGHRHRVAGGVLRDHRAHVRLVGERLDGQQHVEVARVERPVAGLAAQAAGRVQLVEGLAQAAEVLEVGHRRLAALVALAHERRALRGGEEHVPAADADCALRIAGHQIELAWVPQRRARAPSRGRSAPPTPRPAGRPCGSARASRRAGTRCRCRRAAAATPARAPPSRRPRGCRSGACRFGTSARRVLPAGRGMVTLKTVAPGCERTLMAPRWPITIRRAMSSPRPVPSPTASW